MELYESPWVAIQRSAGAVVPTGLAGIGVAGEVLHVTQAAAGIQRGGDGGMAERVTRWDPLVDPGPPRQAARDPAGSVPIQPPQIA